MEVKLIGRSNACWEDDGLWNVANGEELCASAARGCYSVYDSKTLLKSMTQERMEKTLVHAIEAGHTSVLEHIQFTFSVKGVSRVLTHQLVRHRHLSFSQQSMRYVDVHKLSDNIVIPTTVKNIMENEESLADTISEQPMMVKFNNYLKAMHELMAEMDKHGIPSEDQRYFVPNGVMANITVTGNARAWIEFCKLRCCTRAQKEIREMADKIKDILKEECPFIFQNLGPSCEIGYCPEKESCGRKPTLIQVLNGYSENARIEK